MKAAKRKKLKAKGWKVGNTADFLGLSDEEAAYIEMKLKLCNGLKNLRIKRHMTQEGLAKLIKSSQSRVAKMETGDPSVSIDLVVKSMLALGATEKEIAKTIFKSKAA
ncbi:MAG: helix-turn-helix domain-containing protein [Gammaproteobacteria bacterium]|nr:helix-turn-helix domain-containing protein [Gammaproteobacteria bacterium]